MDINDVSGWFCRILGPLGPNLGLRTSVESYMRATEESFKAGDEVLFPTSTRAQRMPPRPTISLVGLGHWIPNTAPSNIGRVHQPAWAIHRAIVLDHQAEGRGAGGVRGGGEGGGLPLTRTRTLTRALTRALT